MNLFSLKYNCFVFWEEKKDFVEKFTGRKSVFKRQKWFNAFMNIYLKVHVFVNVWAAVLKMKTHKKQNPLFFSSTFDFIVWTDTVEFV